MGKMTLLRRRAFPHRVSRKTLRTRCQGEGKKVCFARDTGCSSVKMRMSARCPPFLKEIGDRFGGFNVVMIPICEKGNMYALGVSQRSCTFPQAYSQPRPSILTKSDEIMDLPKRG